MIDITEITDTKEFRDMLRNEIDNEIINRLREVERLKKNDLK